MTVPENRTSETSGPLTDSLNATVAITESLPPGTVKAAQQAFTSGLDIASLVAGVAVAAATVLCLGMLCHVPTLGEAQNRDTGV